MNLNYEIIASLLTAADWDYQYNMQRVNEEKMRELIGQLDNSKISVDLVEKHCENESFASNEIAAMSIADSIAQELVDCPYETVTFIANI